MSRRFFRLVLSGLIMAVAVCGMTGVAHAKGKPKLTQYTVAEVDDVLGVITIAEQDGDRKAYTVTQSTKIMINGSAGKLAEVKAGMRVASFAPTGVDKLGSITLSGSASAPDKKTGGKKKK